MEGRRPESKGAFPPNWLDALEEDQSWVYIDLPATTTACATGPQGHGAPRNGPALVIGEIRARELRYSARTSIRGKSLRWLLRVRTSRREASARGRAAGRCTGRWRRANMQTRPVGPWRRRRARQDPDDHPPAGLQTLLQQPTADRQSGSAHCQAWRTVAVRHQRKAHLQHAPRSPR